MSEQNQPPLPKTADTEITEVTTSHIDTLIANISERGFYSAKKIRELEVVLRENKDTTVSNLDELLKIWEKEQHYLPADFAAEALNNLHSWAALIEGTKKEPTLGKKIVEKTISFLAKYVSFNKNTQENPLIDLVDISKGMLAEVKAETVLAISRLVQATSSNSIESKDQLKKFLEYVLQAESQSIQTQTAIKEILEAHIDNWWLDYVARIKIDKRGVDKDGDEILVQPTKGDKYLQEKGAFVLGFDLEKKTKKNVEEFGIALIYHDLRERIFTARTTADKPPYTTPLPIRKKKGYTVLFDAGSGELYKLNIPLDLLKSKFDNPAFQQEEELSPERIKIEKSNEFSLFKSFVLLALEDARNNRLEASDPRFVVAHKVTQSTQQDKELKNQLYQDEAVQRDLFDLDNADAADLRICLRNFGTDTEIGKVQNNPDFDPLGVRIPHTYSVSVSDRIVQSVQTINSHAFGDGYELAKRHQKTISLANQTELSPNLKKVEFAPISDPKSITEFPALTTANLATTNPVSTAVLGPKMKDKEESSQPQTDVMTKLYNQCDRLQPDSLASFYKETFGVFINESVLISIALMHTLGISHMHFLDKDQELVAPILIGMPEGVSSMLEQLQKSKLTPGRITNYEVDSLLNLFSLFSEGKQAFKAKPKKFKKGRSALEVLSVISGVYKNLLSPIASLLNPLQNEMATNSVLVSMLLEKDRGSIDKEALNLGVRLREFTTSTAEVYKEKGSIGICQNSSDNIKVTYRSGINDLVAMKFGHEKKPQEAFSKALEKSLADVLNMLEIVKQDYLKKQVLAAA